MKRFFTSFIIIALLFSSLPVRAHEFLDVPISHDHYGGVQYLVNKEIVPQTKNFFPDSPVNYGAFVKYISFLHNFNKCNPVRELPSFFQNNNYGNCLQKAIELGIIDTPPSLIRPYKALYLNEALYLGFKSYGLAIPRVYDETRGELPELLKGHKDSALLMEALKLKIIDQNDIDQLLIEKKGLTRSQAANLIYDFVFATSRLNSPPPTSDPDLNKIQAALELITKKFLYSDDVDKASLIDAALLGLTESLNDPYSNYLDSEQTKAFTDSLNQNFEGIGAFIEETGDEGSEERFIMVIDVVKESPAEKAGVKPGDLILEVDGVSLQGYSLEAAASLIRGPQGSTVILGIKRENQSNLLQIEITRSLVKIDSTEYEIKSVSGHKIMHATLNRFGENTFKEFKNIVEVMRGENVDGLLIDLRNNPGGLLVSVVDVLSLFLPKDEVILSIENSNFNQKELSAGLDDVSGEFPTVVLVNERSASASEIMAGVLQHYELATIVGKATFGKGTVQNIFFFNTDQSSLKLTIANYLIGGQNINGVGIIPDIVVQEGDGTEDLQLKEALVELNKKL